MSHSTVQIFHNPRCSKSRETLQLLQEKGIEPEVVEYLKEVPDKKQLTALIDKLGIAAHQLVRKNEPDYAHFKGKQLTDTQWIDAMIQYPKLIERPIVVKGDKAVLGRPPQNVLDLI